MENLRTKLQTILKSLITEKEDGITFNTGGKFKRKITFIFLNLVAKNGTKFEDPESDFY